jgi:hypothetical protein
MGLRFTLSHPVTNAITPGDAELFKIAINMRDTLSPLSNKEVAAIKIKAGTAKPLFSYSG